MSDMSGSGPILPITDAQVVETMRAEIEKSETSGPRRAIEKFVVAALSSIPWVGILMSAAANLKSEAESNYQNYLLKIWVEQHQRKLIELGQTLQEIQSRFQNFGDEINNGSKVKLTWPWCEKPSGCGISRILKKSVEC